MSVAEPLILGIESSCDETSAALMQGFRVISHVVYSQLVHRKYGGVVPEIASREHERVIREVCMEVMDQGDRKFTDLHAVAVTYGPGLMGALLVGVNFAKGLSLSLDIPLIAVNHIEGHLYAPFIQFPDLKTPFLCLLVSGGHTMIIDVEDAGSFSILGTTLDDAAGECFDKTARLMNIGYPGGPVIDRLARDGKKDAVAFPRPLMGPDSLDFSFSGLKTAVLNYVRKQDSMSDQDVKDAAASFQEAVVDTLVEKMDRAVKLSGRDKIVLAGGVAANSRLRQRMDETASAKGLSLYYPPIEYCTDNAAMIAAAASLYYKKGQFADLSLQAVPNLKLS